MRLNQQSFGKGFVVVVVDFRLQVLPRTVDAIFILLYSRYNILSVLDEDERCTLRLLSCTSFAVCSSRPQSRLSGGILAGNLDHIAECDSTDVGPMLFHFAFKLI